jgi:purine-cytosine permease-like protein
MDNMHDVRSKVTDTVLGLLAWIVVLGLGLSFSFLASFVTWRVLLPVEFALLGSVVLAAFLLARRDR